MNYLFISHYSAKKEMFLDITNEPQFKNIMLDNIKSKDTILLRNQQR